MQNAIVILNEFPKKFSFYPKVLKKQTNYHIYQFDTDKRSNDATHTINQQIATK